MTHCQFCETSFGSNKRLAFNFDKGVDADKFIVCGNCYNYKKRYPCAERPFGTLEDMVVWCRGSRKWKAELSARHSMSRKALLISQYLARGVSGVPSDGFGNVSDAKVKQEESMRTNS